MAELPEKKVFKNVEIIRDEIPQITLPQGMDYDSAIMWIQRKKAEETKVVAFTDEIIGPFPLDTLVAFNKALAQIYGWIDLRPTPGFFKDNPPAIISVPVGFNEMRPVAYGNFVLPMIHGIITTHLKLQRGIKPSFIITSEIQARDVPKLKEIAETTRNLVQTESIYKGKAVHVSWEWLRNGQKFDMMHHSPKFMDLSRIETDEMVFNDDIREMLEDGLWTPIMYAESCRKVKTPLKRGVLLEGPYGTGKSLVASATAKICRDHNVSFFNCESVMDIIDTAPVARYYEQSVMFAEDVEGILGGQDRTEEMNQISLCMDGVDAKHSEVITVFTTNHVERINKLFIRPGRFDDIIPFRNPDSKSATQLVKNYGRGMFAADTDFDAIGARLANKSPAMIRKIVENSKLATINRLKGEDIVLGRVNDQDIARAAQRAEKHEALCEEKQQQAKRYMRLTIPLPADEETLPYAEWEAPPVTNHQAD